MRTTPRLILALFSWAAAASAQETKVEVLNEAPRSFAVPSSQAEAIPPAQAPPPALTVTPSQREMSRIFFNAVYPASEGIPIDWTGDTASGNAGTTTQAFRDAVALRVNYFRAMSGIPATITFSSTYNGKDQKAALMMSANDQLSHTPPSTWTFYTDEGAEAANNSNLYLGRFGPTAITGYIEDPGAGNAEAGHRRWILYPHTHTMGTGDVPISETYKSANALWVIDPGASAARPATRESFVAWPPPGYVPYTLIFPRWSFAYPGADFSTATVTMTRNGANLQVQIQSRTDNGFGDNTLIWVPDGLNANLTPPVVAPASDTTTHVTVANFKVGAQTKSFSYDVISFDPTKTGGDTVLPTITGPAHPIVGSANAYSFVAVPSATAYQWRRSTLSAYAAIEGAENGLANASADVPAGYNPISTTVSAAGSASFHLTHPGFQNQFLTLNPLLLTSATSQLQFKSRLRYATAGQIARVQISEDEGRNWSDIYTQAGSNSSGETSFASRSVSLAAYAGKLVRIRLFYEALTGQSAYTQTDAGFGWYIDEIAVTNSQQTGAFVTADVTNGTQFDFVPAQEDPFLLQVVPQFFGQYYLPLDAGISVASAPPGTSVHFETSQHATRDSSGHVTLKLIREGDPTLAFSVNVSTENGSATAGVDYTAKTNFPVSFAVNQMNATVDVDVTNRAGYQGDRSFTASLSGPTNNATLSVPTSTTILIHDSLTGEISFSAAAYQKTQNPSGDSVLPIVVSRVNGTYGAASVTVASTGGTAVAGTDYSLPAGPITLNWVDGEGGDKTVNLTVKGGTIPQGVNRTVLLVIQNVTGGVNQPEPQSATVTLTGVDAIPPTLTLTSPSANGKITAADVTIRGTAKDAGGINRVEVRIDQGPVQNATLTAITGGVEWTLSAAPEQGVNTVEVRAFDLQGNTSTAIVRNFSFANLRLPLAGVYQGLVTPTPGIVDESKYGFLTITVTKVGTFTGKLTISGVTLPVGGVFLTNGEARFGKTLTPTLALTKTAKPVNLSFGFLSLVLDTGAGHKIIGAILDAPGPGAQTLATIGQANQSLFTSKKVLLPPQVNVPTTILDPEFEKGRYTAIFRAVAAPNNGLAKDKYPQGNGWAKVTVSTAGVVKIVGKIADGSTVTYSATLSQQYHCPVFVPLYGGKGFLAGDVVFAPAAPASDASDLGMKWYKPDGLKKPTNYPDGWPQGIAIDFLASKFVAPKKPTAKIPNPPNPDTILGAGLLAAPDTATANIAIAASEGGLNPATSNDASISAASKITILRATLGHTAADTLKATLAADGTWSGSFIHPTTGKAVPYKGVVFQKTRSASGYFLFAPAKNVPATSGAVDLIKK